MPSGSELLMRAMLRSPESKYVGLMGWGEGERWWIFIGQGSMGIFFWASFLEKKSNEVGNLSEIWLCVGVEAWYIDLDEYH